VSKFREGSASAECSCRQFRPGSWHAASDWCEPSQSLALQYRTPDNRERAQPAYIGDSSLGECIANFVAATRTIARITVAAPIATTDGLERRALAARAHAEIACAIGVADVAASSGQQDAATSARA